MFQMLVAEGFWDIFDKITSNQFVGSALHVVWEIIIALIIWAVGKKLIKWALKLMDSVFEHRNMEVSVRKFLLMTLKWLLYGVLVFIIVEYVSGTTASLMALLGSLGVTVGLALQGSLSNVAGGVLILLMRPFRVGDFITYGGNSGTVNEIGLIYTKLTTVDNQEVVVPNGALANGTVVNATAFETRRVDARVSIAASEDMSKAKQVLAEMVSGYDKLLKDQEISVFIQSVGGGAVVIEMRLWVAGEYYWDALAYVTENAKTALEAAGIAAPLPQMGIHNLSK